MNEPLQIKMKKLGYELYKENPLILYNKETQIEIHIDCGCISKWDSCNCETVPFTRDELMNIAKYIMIKE